MGKEKRKKGGYYRQTKTTNVYENKTSNGGTQFRTTIPAWIISKVFEAEPGEKIKLSWDFQGDKAILRRIKE